jgi:hypothetical protein
MHNLNFFFTNICKALKININLNQDARFSYIVVFAILMILPSRLHAKLSNYLYKYLYKQSVTVVIKPINNLLTTTKILIVFLADVDQLDQK